MNRTDTPLQPLAGRRVIEFANVAAGPYCGLLLSDMGADVIKVEKPGGDDLRHWPPITNGFSENFASLNRNKRSIVLDLKSENDLATARALCESADIVLENNRPGVMDRLGLGYEALKSLNPRIIVCSISAFGQQGPASQIGGFDLTVQAASGIMSVTGEPDRPPVKCGMPVSDFATGLYGAFAIASALLEVDKTGEGTHIDVSMLGASLGISALQTSEYFGTGDNAPPMGSRHPRNAPYQAFVAQDGYFVMAAGNNKLFASVCDAIERPELIDDARFVNPPDRAQHQSELQEIIESMTASLSVAECVKRFADVGVPCGPINSYGDALAHPQVSHSGWVQPITLPGGAKTKTFGSPVLFDQQPIPVRHNPPALNADADKILEELKTLK